MPLINPGGASLNAGSRSFTNLIKSPGDAPSGQWVIDPTLPGLFTYPYAVNRRLSKVVIPKGSIVATGPAVKDYYTQKYRNIITFANGTNNAIGVAPYSYFRRFNADGSIAHDQFGGDDFQPGIITREFIEVPYIPNPADVYTYSGTTPTITGMKFYYGAATNESVANIDTANELKAGDFVKAGPYGKFLRWIPGTDGAQLIIGQVLELDTDMPPQGWLQYIEQVYEGRMSNREEFTPEPAPEDGSMVYDPDYTWPYTEDNFRPGAPSQAWKTIGGGQKGLTDGAEIAKTVRIERDQIDNGEDTVVVDLDPIAKVLATSISVTIDGTTVDPEPEDTTPTGAYWSFNAATQRITVVDSGTSGDREVIITYRVDPKSMIGVPASWDFAGSIGMARILLKL
jgi:hypothetical protein